MSTLDYKLGNDFWDPTPISLTAARSERIQKGPVPPDPLPVPVPESDPMTRAEFGRRFKAAREARGLSQAQAAARVGVPQPRIAEYESGFRVPPVPRLLELIEVLELDPAVLFPEFFG